MIHELLNGVVEERKFSIPVNAVSSCNSQSAVSSPTTSSEALQQNLRCPRCDSSNTKFCYYNNYNLTQPRHFCKTCRRYWTKGGALRNVPIGGGCRKTKSVSPSIAAAAAAGSASSKVGGAHKAKPMMSASDIVGLAGIAGGLDHAPKLLHSVPPYSSHLLALLKASSQMQNPNPNLNLNSFRIKDELGVMANTHTFENQHFQQQMHHDWLLNDMATNYGIQELYQRLRSSTNNYCSNEQLEMTGNNVNSNANSHPSFGATNTTMTATTTSIMEPVSTLNGEFGLWNIPAMAWSDISASNGAFP